MTAAVVAMRYSGDVIVAIQPMPDGEFVCHLRACRTAARNGVRCQDRCDSAEVNITAPPDLEEDELTRPETFDRIAVLAIMTVNMVAVVEGDDPFRCKEGPDSNPMIAREEDESWGPE